jgi:ATP-grasp domain
MTPRVLLAHGMFWPNIGRLAIAFRKAGFIVDAVAPSRHPVHRMRSPSRTFKYRQISAYDSIRDAVDASHPDLIVPCDDRVVGHLHRLHKDTSAARAGSDMRRIASLIETSLGSPSSYHVVTRRSSLAELAQLPDVHIPRTAHVDSFQQLLDWVQQYGLPAVLKLDGSSGGWDVIMIRTMRDVVPSLLRMRFYKMSMRRMKSLLFGDDIEPFLAPGILSSAGVCVQSYVPGRLANCAVACWRGNVLAWTAVEVLQRSGECGVATIVRRVKGEPMIAAARSIARHLQLSGFFGFDFVLDQHKPQANLIEINPRATQINHFPSYDSPDLPAALFGAICNKEVPRSSVQWSMDEVALFPNQWNLDPASEWFSKAIHDVPSEEPELVRYFASKYYESISRISAFR